MGTLEGELFGLPYRGNAGAQYIHTNQGSTGLIVDNGRCAGVAGQACPAYTIAGHHSYNDFLPSLNLNVELPADQVLRLGIGKTLSRPNMSDMRPGGGVGLDATNPAGPILAGGSGNPKLEPFRAKSFDLSYEKYFEANGAKGYVAMAGFYKKLDTYILRAPQRVDFASTGFLVAGIPLPATGPNAGSTVGILTTPSNGSGGNIKGLELTASLPFAMLTRYLGGFGIEASYSSTLSSVTLPRTGVTVISNGSVNAIPLPGLSHTVTNMRVYYEKAGFRASIAARKRGDFVGDIHDYKDDASLTYIKGNTTVDGQLTYDFGDTTLLKGLSLTAAVNNWTNSPYIRYNGDPSSVVENVKFGRTYSLGASYKF
jgi:iron complex outermembrane receptor protein